MTRPLVRRGRPDPRQFLPDGTPIAPDSTAVRVALWRALHTLADPPPHLLKDELGLRLAEPEAGWRQRPDMELSARARARASIVARARFIEDLVGEAAVQGVSQYVLLGAGLDTYAQRRPAGSPPLVVYEVDREGPQVWKRRRLVRLGYAEPEWLKFVPVDLVQDARWVEGLIGAGYAVDQAAVVAAAGLSMYLERPALLGLLGRSARLAPGSTLVMSYLVPLDRVDEEERQDRQSTEKFARAAGTPFVGCYAPEEMRELVLRAGFARVRTVSGKDLERMFFAGRSDGLRPSSSEELVVAEV